MGQSVSEKLIDVLSNDLEIMEAVDGRIYPVTVRDVDDDNLPNILTYSTGRRYYSDKDKFFCMNETICVQVCSQDYGEFCKLCDMVAARIGSRMFGTLPNGIQLQGIEMKAEEYDDEVSGYFREIIFAFEIDNLEEEWESYC
ncbi:MAG: hypothetical protein ACI382_02715 [Alloprevotella sp.]